MNKNVFTVNNLDLLRLFAALQVATHHAFGIMQIHLVGWPRDVLHFTSIIPGVPIFFFISGYLITKSFENNVRLSDYCRNRFLRLYPGLICAVTLSFVFLYVSGYIVSTNVGLIDLITLFAAKTTILQFYNPDFMRGYGDGVLNGSLWTITVEVQFYILVPIIYRLLEVTKSHKSNRNLLFLLLAFFLLNRIYSWIPHAYQGGVAFKLTRVSFIPWFYMFLLGMLFQRNFRGIYKVVSNKFMIVLPIYCVVAYLGLTKGISFGNNINPLMYIFLIFTVMSFAYSWAGMSRRVLRGNDISYGIYIYHMPVVNFMLFNGMSGLIKFGVAALVGTIFVAIISWRVVEKQCLKRKRQSLKPIPRSAVEPSAGDVVVKVAR